MKVEFRRTGERRYAVTVFRENYPTLEMNPAPGYDALMPHDLMQFIVENELGLRCGICGQLADGGNAGTFRSLERMEPYGINHAEPLFLIYDSPVRSITVMKAKHLKIFVGLPRKNFEAVW